MPTTIKLIGHSSPRTKSQSNRSMSTELNQHSAWPTGPDRVYLYVDFNEMVDTDCYLLSKTDIKTDRYGNQIRIVENMPIVGFMDDIDQNGEPGILTVDGYAELNDGTGGWSAEQVKWCIRVQKDQFRHEKW